MSVDLPAWLADADPVRLLPARRHDEALRIIRPLSLLGACWFDDARGYALVRDARGVTYGVPFVVDADGPRRAAAGDGVSAALLAALPRLAGNQWLRAKVFEQVAVQAAGGESGIDVDQTNDLVVVNGTDRGPAVVKWDLHPMEGEQAGPARLAALAESGFAGTPRTFALVRTQADGSSFGVATVSQYVRDAQDGWQWAVDDVRALAVSADDRIDAAVDAVADLVARMHAALAGKQRRRATRADASHWDARARALVDSAGLPEADAAEVGRRIGSLGEGEGTATIMIHADLHVGQVLRTGDPPRYLVIDFDGNPTEDASERAMLQPAARDVAGMLASWDHVGRVVLHRTPDLDASARERVLAWIERSQREFLAAYAAALAAAGCGDLLDRRLLTAYQVLQECREYAYARRYLPHWRFVPDAALPALLARSTPEREDGPP